MKRHAVTTEFASAGAPVPPLSFHGTALLLVLLCGAPAPAADPDEQMPGQIATLRSGKSLTITTKPPPGERFSLPGVSHDPTLSGGSLALFDTGAGGAGSVEFSLPVQALPRGWRAMGSPPGTDGYRYRGSGAANDPCTIDLRPSGVRISCQGSALGLVPPFAADLGAVLTLGTGGKRYCTSFGGVNLRNDSSGLKRRNSPAGAACPEPFVDSDGDGVPDSSDLCPGADDHIDLDRNGAPDPCQELAARTKLDDFDGYASDAALAAMWTAWPQGGDATLARAPDLGESGTTAMQLTAVGPDPVTGSTWTSVSRGIGAPPAGAHDGVLLWVEHAGTVPLGLGVTLTEAGGEPFVPAGVSVRLLPEGQAWQDSANGDPNGVIVLPAGFRGLMRLRFSDLTVASWYSGTGDQILDQGQLARVSFGFNVAGRSGEHLRVDSLAWWYEIDAAIAGRVAGRSWPSILQAWNGIADEPTVDARDLIARHDLLLDGPFGLRLFWSSAAAWEPCTPGPGESCVGLLVGFTPASVANSAAYLAELRARNPNLLVIAEIRYRDAWASYLPASHRFWQHDGQGNRIPGWSEGSFYLLDWHDPEFRDLVAAQAGAAVAAGADGVFLDWWDDTDDDRVDLARRIRAAIGARLLWVNNNDRISPRSAPWVNGAYMEGYQSASAAHWQQLGDALAWNETWLRQPRVNGLETWFENSRDDVDRMRATTTLGLVRSDGYAMFGDPNDLSTPDHLHSWYAFWDEPLGVALAPGVLLPDGSWRREFSGGTTVYNPMGNGTVQVTFGSPRRSAATGVVATQHTLPARDGDLYIP